MACKLEAVRLPLVFLFAAVAVLLFLLLTYYSSVWAWPFRLHELWKAPLPTAGRPPSPPPPLTAGFAFSHLARLNAAIGPQAPPYRSPETYLAPNSTKDERGFVPCSSPQYPRTRATLFTLLRRLVAWSSGAPFTWMLAYGSLLGSLRSGEMNPWDSDMDLHFLAHEAERLVSARASLRRHGLRLVVRREGHCPFDGSPRTDCSGRRQTSLVDSCSFCGPFGRLFLEPQGAAPTDNQPLRSATYADVYLLYVDRADDGRAVLFDEGMQEGTNERLHFNLSVVFPLRLCPFLGLQLPCPHKPLQMLARSYSSDFLPPPYLCESATGEWVRPQTHF